MSLTIFLTADLHLGMKFAHLPDVQEELAEARFQCLVRLVSLANKRKAELLVVAGDLFDRVSVTKRDIERAASFLGDFQGALCAVLPGNHDYLSPDDELWRRFQDAAPSVLLLSEPRPYPLSKYGLDACLYPGPCPSKHSRSNAVGWIKAAEKSGDGKRIGVAHGSLEGVSADFKADYFPMKERELWEKGLDLWLLGHTHVRYPQKPEKTDKIFCAGTPEPDGFDCGHEGFAWILTLGERGVSSAEAVSTGAFRFIREEVEICSEEALSQLEKRHAGGANRILKVSLRGRLAPEAFPGLEKSRVRLASLVKHLQWDASGMREEVSRETIDREYPAGSFPHRLLTALADKGDTLGLETAYDLLKEAAR
jgi:exonuclease SbcD